MTVTSLIRLTGSNGSPSIKVTESASLGTLIHTAANEEEYLDQVYLYGNVNSYTEQEFVLQVSGSAYGVNEIDHGVVSARDGNVSLSEGEIVLTQGEKLYAYCPTSINSLFLKGYVERVSQSLGQQASSGSGGGLAEISILSDISGCIACWRADLETSHSSGQLASWLDQTSYNNDASPTSGPTCDANAEASYSALNNQAVVAFTGSASEGMWKQTASGSTGLTGMSFVCIFDPGADDYNFAPGLLLYRNGLGSSSDDYGFNFDDNLPKCSFTATTSGENYFGLNAGIPTSGAQYVVGRWDATGSLGAEYWINSILTGSAIPATGSITANLDFLINIRNTTVDTTESGRIAEAAIFNKYLNDTELQQIAAYVEQRYGIVSGSIPS